MATWQRALTTNDTEFIEDTVGAMLTGNTETNITVTYQDGDGTIDFASENTTYSVQDGELSQNSFTDADHSKLNAIEASATADQTAGEILTLIEDGVDSVHYKDGSIDTVHLAADAVTAAKLADNAVVFANLTSSTITSATEESGIASGDFLLFSDSSELGVLRKVDYDDLISGDITAVTLTTDSGSGSKASETSGSADFSIVGVTGVGVTNLGTTITVTTVDSEIAHDSLSGFVANEHLDWTASVGTIHSDNYTNTTYSVGDGGLTTNDFTNADHSKLNAIEASADVTDTTNVTAAGALMDSECADLAAVKATTGTFLSADETKLDAIEASADVTDKTNVSAALATLTGDDTLTIGDAGNDATINIKGNLNVSGTTTTVNTETIKLADNIILLNSNEDGTPSENAGIEIERGTSSNVSIYWEESKDSWFASDGSVAAEIGVVERVTGSPDTNDDGYGTGSFQFNTSTGDLWFRTA